MTDRLAPQDLQESQHILASLFKDVSTEEGTLASGIKLGMGGIALQALRETKATFGNPRNDLIQLTPRLFKNIGVELTEVRKQQMRNQFDFYYMTLTVSMQTKHGIQFSLMECSLDFGPKGPDEPIVQTIFPTGTWRELLRGKFGISLALNGNLEWSAGVDTSAASIIANLPGQVKANVANKDMLKAFVAVPNFSFSLGRPDIAADGEGNSECFWRIENPELQERQTVQFGIVFKVAKGTDFIELTGLVAVEPSINWLAANVRDVFEYLSEQHQALIQRREEERSGKERLPIGDHERWHLKLPQ